MIYHGGNVLFRTADRGKTWAPISPDLTRNDKATQGLGRHADHERGRGRRGVRRDRRRSPSRRTTRTRSTSAPTTVSCRSRATAARRGRTSRRPASASGSRTRSRCRRTTPATVYLAFRMDRRGDYAPYAFKSTDYGKTWTRIVDGPARRRAGARGARGSGASRPALRGHGDGRLRVVRRRRELAAAVAQPAASCRWPTSRCATAISYAATEGRAFWALDDLSAAAADERPTSRKADVHLFAPRPALLGGGPSAPTTTAGRNPPPGANVYYSLATAPDSARR